MGSYQLLPQSIAADGSTGGTTSIDLSNLSSVVEGNVCLAHFSMSADVTVTPPSGWVQVYSYLGARLFYTKTVGAGAQTFSFSSSIAIRWAACDLGEHVDQDNANLVVTVGTMSDPASTTPISGTITPGVDKATIATVLIAATTDSTITAPSGVDSAHFLNIGAAGGASGSFAVGTFQHSGTGATTATDWSSSGIGVNARVIQIGFHSTNNLLTPLVTEENLNDYIVSGTWHKYDRTAGSWVEGTGYSNGLDADQLSPHLNEAITTAVANGDTGMGLAEGANSSGQIYVHCTDVNTDLLSMDTLGIRISMDETSVYSDDEFRLICRVMMANGSTILASFDSSTTWRTLAAHSSAGAWSTGGSYSAPYASSGVMPGAPKYDHTFMFDYVNQTATKADWNDLRVYFYAVDNRNMGSDGAAVSVVDFELVGSFTPATSVPDTITDLSGTLGDQQVALSWTAPAANPAITDYEYRVDGGTWTSTGSTSPNYTVTSLTNGTSYSFEVRAVNANGNADASNLINRTPGTVPGAPTALDVDDAYDSTLDIVWTAPADDGGYTITDYEYRLDGGVWTTLNTASSPGQIGGLTNGVEYDIEVRAVNSLGSGPASNLVSGTPNTVPDAVDDLSATPGDGQVTLSWTAPTNDGTAITHYEYSVDGGAYTTTGSAVPGYTVTPLTNGIQYSFKVRAVNVYGNAPDSNVVNATPSAGSPHFFLGDLEVTAIKLGDTNVTKAYLGDTQVFPDS